MANPKLIDSKKHASLKNRFFKLHERFMETPIRKIMCYIYDDVEEADKWVRLEHTGEQNGVGNPNNTIIGYKSFTLGSE